VESSGLCAARRALLLGAGAAGLAVVTGCGSSRAAEPDGGESTAATEPGEDAGANAPGPAPTTGDPFAGFPSGDAPPPGAIVAVKDVPVGGGVLVRDTRLVVQPKAGTFKAFSAVCPHEGVTVQPPVNGAAIMECPGHNSQFKAADGSLVRGPATRGLSGIAVKVQKGYVVEV
jgi:nitrite reductase/ring-hydroxylating ferredoxin subunit